MPSRFDSHRLLFVDVETGGLSAQTSSIVEIACITTDIRSREVLDKWCLKVIPGLPVAEGAAKVNGYDASLWEKEAVSQVEALARLRQSIGGEHAFMVAHKADFDWSFISKLAYDNSWDHEEITALICTLNMAKVFLPGYENDRSLSSLIRRFELPASPNHRALADTESCLLLYQEFRRRGIKPFLSKATPWKEKFPQLEASF